MSKGRIEVGIGRGVYGREAIHMNKEADLKDQAKNFRLFSETLEIMKKAWTEEFFSHKGEFYTYPSPNFVWQHDMSPPNKEVVDLKTNILDLENKYNFSDFTESHNNLLLKTAKKNYTFESFGTKSVKPHIILRHDVDLSVHRALALAKLEKKHKIIHGVLKVWFPTCCILCGVLSPLKDKISKTHSDPFDKNFKKYFENFSRTYFFTDSYWLRSWIVIIRRLNSLSLIHI